MSRRYDQKTTTFTSDGRLMQVEYAIEAIHKTGAAIGIMTPQGIILITEREDTSALVEQEDTSDRIFALDDHCICVVSGLTADCNYLVDYARRVAQNHKYTYANEIPLQQLTTRLCDLKQGYTQHGGLRPFGSGFLICGYDEIRGHQLYSTDPSGNYTAWKARAHGRNNLPANSFLKQEYKDAMTLEEGKDLAVKALVKTLDTTSPNKDKIEIQIVALGEEKHVIRRILSPMEIQELLDRNDFGAKKE